MREIITVTGRAAVPAGGILPLEHLHADHAVPDDLAATWSRVRRRRPIAATDRAFYEAPVSIGALSEINLGRANRDDERLDDPALIAGELGRFRERGGRLVVDGTAADAGRDPAALRRIAALSGVDVVASAGWRGPRWDPSLTGRDADDLAAELVAELETGIGEEGVRAGVIALGEPLDPHDPDEAAVLRAAARAAAATDAPLTVALPRAADVPGPDATAHALVDLLLAEGVRPAQLALAGALGLARTPDRIDRLVDRGVWLLFDGLGRIPTVRTEVSDHQAALALIRLGADPTARVLAGQGLRRKIDLTAFGGTGYAFLAEQFLPYLERLGADPAIGRRLSEDAPARFLFRQEA